MVAVIVSLVILNVLHTYNIEKLQKRVFNLEEENLFYLKRLFHEIIVNKNKEVENDK